MSPAQDHLGVLVMHEGIWQEVTSFHMWQLRLGGTGGGGVERVGLCPETLDHFLVPTSVVPLLRGLFCPDPGDHYLQGRPGPGGREGWCRGSHRSGVLRGTELALTLTLTQSPTPPHSGNLRPAQGPVAEQGPTATSF